MTKLTLDWPQSAVALLSQARSQSASDGELLRLILAGTHHLDSWLIEKRVLPALQEKQLKTLRLRVIAPDQAERSAAMVPLPDASAFACSVEGLWSALEATEAHHEIAYIGSRYAPGDRWLSGFQATLQLPDGAVCPVTPSGVARMWLEATGSSPAGFAVDALDHVQSMGLDVLDRAFNTQGRLGL
jgi:hypothetical protein